ncbi:pectinesterase family protein [Fulvivirga ulvae]|uniref:pectinesterase family protein n=1 Tax=Fulvivirga ulvae TaxID=2904245 RepID=UPI001F349397|nr:pectinesterase family protein [Fulvivirga ulvae]UII33895.1 pectinesterase family protein [Fulvivirga ulvae]
MKNNLRPYFIILLLIISVMRTAWVNAHPNYPGKDIDTINKSTRTLQPEPGTTYTYSLTDGSEMPQDTEIKYDTFVTSDSLLTLKSNVGTQLWWHDPAHGVAMYNANSFEVKVAGDAIITLTTCTYSADNAVFSLTDQQGNSLGSMVAENTGEADGFPVSFAYSGNAGVVKATLQSSGTVYIHAIAIENAPEIGPGNGKIDVWDFGAEQLNSETYNNMLTESEINSWYDGSITPGTSGSVLPSFSSGVLSWVGGSGDRLRTTNTNLTRYDENLSGVSGYTGRVYVNSRANEGRNMSLTLNEDDEVTVMLITDADGIINFQYVVDPSAHTDLVAVGTDLTELQFVAKQAGTYRIFDTQAKPSYYRIYRKDATYATITGSVDESLAGGIPNGYGIRFTNQAGKTWTSVVNSGQYSVELPAGYTYELELTDAAGYFITSSSILEVTEATTNLDVTVEQIELYTVNGNITGLGANISSLQLAYTPDPVANKIFIPQPAIDLNSASYTVQLEPDVEYTVSAVGVNDYHITNSTITIGAADQSSDIIFASKPVYGIAITTSGLDNSQLSSLSLTFTNLYEDGYVYTFSAISDVALRDGSYVISYAGLDDFPVQMALTSNLTVNGAVTAKTLDFVPVTVWSFDDQEISGSTTSYKGILLSGSMSNDVAKGHLSAKSGATIQVPIDAGKNLRVSYYFSADFSIDGGDPVTTSTGSTGLIEHVDYVYPGSGPGYATITIGSTASTTYLTEIAVYDAVDYAPEIYVGVDKPYKTIKEALDAITKMERNNDERVTVMIDPGNYEEMLVIKENNITLKNAAETPSIALKNQGVDIEAGAVRITGYYGLGYNYYSMGPDRKWHADILEVNKQNGYLSHSNEGSGSYWNATVVVTADGFEASHIIFENSFNQYISKKESEDVVVMWEVGGKGERPTDYGNTAIQDRNYVERAAAIAIVDNSDKVILDRCRVVGRQDSFFGGAGARVLVYEGAMMGAVDYIFGAMTAVFYKTNLVMNTSDQSSDASYLTAAQQSAGRGYLMYECRVMSTTPGVETASVNGAKPGYFGRPWRATTSEVVFYKTRVDASEYPGSEGQSLISPIGWTSSLGGESPGMYEYGTIEASGEDNSASRAAWSTLLTSPFLTDGTEITPYNFTKGTDGWDPLAQMESLDNDSLLVSLSVAEGTLVPEFDPLVTSYTVEVPENTKVTVSAQARSSAAKVSIGAFDNIPGSDQVVVTAEDGSTTEYTIEVKQAVTTAVYEKRQSVINLYPNPSEGISNISFHLSTSSDVEVLILTTDGKNVKSYREDHLSTGEQRLSLDCSDLPGGLYQLRLIAGDQTAIMRLILH